MRFPRLLALVVPTLALASTSCIVEKETVIDHEADKFVDQSSQEAMPTAEDLVYPEGATGFTVGKIMPNHSFWGYADFSRADLQSAPSALPGFQLTKASQFYNPDTAGSYPADSPYIKTADQIAAVKSDFPEHESLYDDFDPAAKPNVLVLIIGSVWCGPCVAEAKNVLPGLYAEMRPKGAHVISILFDSKDQGVPATLDFDLVNWSNAYQPTYTMVIDPGRAIGTISPPFYPGGIIVDTQTMKIMHIGSLTGQNEAPFWAIAEQVIAGTYQPPAN
jgi:hypothetical protein